MRKIKSQEDYKKNHDPTIQNNTKPKKKSNTKKPNKKKEEQNKLKLDFTAIATELIKNSKPNESVTFHYVEESADLSINASLTLLKKSEIPSDELNQVFNSSVSEKEKTIAVKSIWSRIWGLKWIISKAKSISKIANDETIKESVKLGFEKIGEFLSNNLDNTPT